MYFYDENTRSHPRIESRYLHARSVSAAYHVKSEVHRYRPPRAAVSQGWAFPLASCEPAHTQTLSHILVFKKHLVLRLECCSILLDSHKFVYSTRYRPYVEYN